MSIPVGHAFLWLKGINGPQRTDKIDQVVARCHTSRVFEACCGSSACKSFDC